jgi:hypothetical protein
MLKRIVFICLVAALFYYAGLNGITPKNIESWFENFDFKEDISQPFENAMQLIESISLADTKKQMSDK